MGVLALTERSTGRGGNAVRTVHSAPSRRTVRENSVSDLPFHKTLPSCSSLPPTRLSSALAHKSYPCRSHHN